ncbi:nuclear transport factor 2 family protein [Acidovorax sp. D2M1]|uniref:Nuclear transport factor 2 family protein n=1 Tax=Acidovorax benzenivorans TaxID=2987520 RepID=A0ABT5RRI5_9BURK|nr:nuclear transport factor 2 family protein [Acidovorax benzenivorans]MDD2176309.1 nuclear transport factor 2 family protein [Acidovorax benzenivorans]
MQPPAPATEEAVTRVVAFFENLSPADVATIGQFYAPQARFKDPFNEVVGVPAIQGIFAHMFEALEQPRFVVTGRVVQGTQCFLTWDFLFAFKDFHKGVTQTVRGASHLVLDEQGLVTLHRDYWDAAEELYEKLPVVGALMRWLKKRANS